MAKLAASEELERRLLIELGDRVRVGGFVYPLLLAVVALQIAIPDRQFWVFWIGSLLTVLGSVWRTYAAHRARKANENWRSLRTALRASSILLASLTGFFTSFALVAYPHSDFAIMVLIGLIGWIGIGSKVFTPDLALAQVVNLISMIPVFVWFSSVHNRFGWITVCIFTITGLFIWISTSWASAHIKKLIQTQIQLEAQADDLRKARDLAEEATRTRTQFLANMSHEIRTPLNGIIGVAGLMAETPLDPEQRELVGLLTQSGTHLLTLVDDLLDISKINAGKLLIAHVEFDLRRLLDEVCRPLQWNAKGKGLEWHLTVHKDLPQFCVGDPVRVRQVLSNLLSNALKFTDHGGVSIDVCMVDGKQMRFVVEDTGIGIDAAKLDGIFEAFEQADHSTTRRFGGTGLGLTISKKLVEIMGGRIGVESALGQGSMFWFELAISENRS